MKLCSMLDIEISQPILIDKIILLYSLAFTLITPMFSMLHAEICRSGLEQKHIAEILFTQ